MDTSGSGHNRGVSVMASSGALQSGPSFLPSLQRCVFSLERSTKKIKSTVAILDEATSNFPKLKAITGYAKQYEFVSVQDIKSMQVEVAKEIEPQLFALLDRAVEMVVTLESKEQDLINQVNVEAEKANQRQLRKSALKSELSNIKRLQTLTRRTSELSRSSKELDDALDQKRRDFGDLIERANDYNLTGGPGAKRIRRLSNVKSQGLGQIEESKKEGIRLCEQEIIALRKKVADQREEIARRNASSTSCHEASATVGWHPIFSPSDVWEKYMAQYDFFVASLQSELRVDAKDKETYDSHVAKVTEAYKQELREMIDTSGNELDLLLRGKEQKLAHMRALCKQLFPRDNIGTTMARVLELLVKNPQKECYYSDFEMTEFPPSEEKRHNFSKVMEILKNLGLIEVMLEGREIDDIETSKKLVVRIRFDDSTKEAV